MLDVESGAVHEIDKAVYTVVEDFDRCVKNVARDEIKISADGMSPEQVAECIDELYELYENGLLCTDASIEPIEIGEQHVKALCLHIAHDCNLSCEYCFAGKGDYHGERSMMSLETGKRAIDFLIASSGPRRNLEVDFFGGEPTMNMDVVKGITEYARSIEKQHGKNFRFTLTTNALLLDEGLTDFINTQMQNVVLSIDGREEVHNRMRKTANGKDSYKLVLQNSKMLAESREHQNYYVRGTYTHFNPDFAADVLHLADLGFKHISVEPVVTDSQEAYSIKREDIPQLLEEYERLAIEMKKRREAGEGFNFFHFNIDLKGGPCIIKRIKGCGAGSEYLAVTPEGDLYPCHQTVGDAAYRMGDVHTGIQKHEVSDRFNKTVLEKAHCTDCFAKYYCSGGCAAKDFYEINCELMRKRVECAIYLY